MTDVGKVAAGRESVEPRRPIEEAFDHLALGIVIFDGKREVVFCNLRYREIYGLTPEQVKPGTPTTDLIRHRLRLGLKIQESPRLKQRSGVSRSNSAMPRR